MFRTIQLALLTAFTVCVPTAEVIAASFTLDIKQQQLVSESKTLRVTRGDQVTLHWTSDSPLEVHLHGYDHEWRIPANESLSTQFNANVSGRFPLTRHGHSGHQGHHEALLYIEVYPD